VLLIQIEWMGCSLPCMYRTRLLTLVMHPILPAWWVWVARTCKACCCATCTTSLKQSPLFLQHLPALAAMPGDWL
jgi:hypothetical protein